MKTFSLIKLTLISSFFFFAIHPSFADLESLRKEYYILIDKGNEHYEKKTFQIAKHFYERAQMILPQNVETYINIAAINIFEEDFKSAIENLNIALKSKVTDETILYSIYYNLGSCYYKQKSYLTAKEFFLKAKKISPNSSQIQQSLQRTTEAIMNDAFKRKEMITAPIEISYQKRSPTPKKILTPSSSKQLLLLSNEAYLNRDIELAQNYLMKALEKEPHLFEAHYRLGTLFTQKEDFINGEKHLKEALKIQPNDASAFLAMGNLYSKQNNFNKALVYYKRAKRYNKTNPNIYYNSALCLAYLKKDRQALKQFKIAKQLASEQNNLPLLDKINKIYKD